MPVPLAEFPIHHVPLSSRHVGTSYRNFYDRWYFNAHDRSGDVFLITGSGVYRNLGVIDAFATVRRGDRQWTVRASDALEHGMLDARVGPYRIEMIEPLSKWKGRDWIDSATYDLTDPQIVGRSPFGVIDHIARATCDGVEGWGMFEHATIGRHDPTGMTDFLSVAP